MILINGYNSFVFFYQALPWTNLEHFVYSIFHWFKLKCSFNANLILHSSNLFSKLNFSLISLIYLVGYWQSYLCDFWMWKSNCFLHWFSQGLEYHCFLIFLHWSYQSSFWYCNLLFSKLMTALLKSWPGSSLLNWCMFNVFGKC